MCTNVTQNVRAVVVAAVMLCFTAPVSAAEFHVDTDAPRKVVFVSEATIESFDGVTEKIDGYAVIPADRLGDVSDFSKTKFYIEVDLASLDTGIGLRNRDMREDYLHTDDFPYAMYSGTIDSVTSLNDSTFLTYTSGDLTIHGVTKSYTTTDTVTARSGSYRVASHFSIALPDHHIEIPQLMFLKISEVVELDLWFVLKRVE